MATSSVRITFARHQCHHHAHITHIQISTSDSQHVRCTVHSFISGHACEDTSRSLLYENLSHAAWWRHLALLMVNANSINAQRPADAGGFHKTVEYKQCF